VVTVDSGVRVRGGRLHAVEEPLWCRESGATLRFLAAIAATVLGKTTLRCAPSLARRPIQPLLEAIRQLGVECDFESASGTLNVVGRRQRSGHVVIRGDVSSQFLSALLMSGVRYEDGLSITLSSPLVSERYVDMTRGCMEHFGARIHVSENREEYRVYGSGLTPAHYVVEGDWSGAAAVLALGALSGVVEVSELYPTSLQADVAMLELLAKTGAQVEVIPGSVIVSRARVEPFMADLAAAIDLLPVACALAAMAHGVTTLNGIARARDKESDRVAAMAEGLTRIGVRVEVDDDRMRVWGGNAKGAVVSSAGDHRIAMAFGVLGAVVGDLVIEGAECVSKTYPGFWDMLVNLGVEATLDE
jgi:3-phosphoshikimate 1-carboxyvinyltransferase